MKIILLLAALVLAGCRHGKESDSEARYQTNHVAIFERPNGGGPAQFVEERKIVLKVPEKER